MGYKMRKTKLYFGLLIITLVAILVFGFRFDYLDRANPNNFVNYGIPKNVENTYSNCTFSLPSQRTIILRMDDIGAGYIPVYKSLINKTISQNISLTLATIPMNVKTNLGIAKYLRNIAKNEYIEIAQHGYAHTLQEFQINTTNPLKLINEGKNILIEKIGVIPTTFIPPYNLYSPQTLEALNKEGFKIISSGQNNYLSKSEIFILDFNTQSFYANKYTPTQEIISVCNKSLNQMQICVIMLHPQDYAMEYNKNIINRSRFEDYQEMLDGLKELNVEFKTFEDLLSC